ncbi:D-aminoacyl-tRNA deacylase 1 [Cyanistes caeruleus]|nr:D-aminoacyl-tRNA deacylase 1 [Cyanistes caeruleus]
MPLSLSRGLHVLALQRQSPQCIAGMLTPYFYFPSLLYPVGGEQISSIGRGLCVLPVGGEQISSIGRGLCVLLGISLEDTQRELEHMVRKILNLRVFEDESGKHWSKSVMDKQYEVLCVSQFTLQCILKGNKPDYHMAMPTEQAESFYNNFLEQLRKAYKPELIKDGKFGAYMQVHIQNDGPVTIELESPAATVDPKQLTKLEKQQQRKEKTRTKVPSESSRERNAPRSKDDPSASSGAEGDVSSEREP